MTAFPEIPDRDLALPTSTEAVRALLDATAACIEAPLHPAPVELLDLACAARHARRFKIDVSFALSLDGRPAARFSVNDKGEPGAFRARLLDRSGVLALARERLEAFFALSPPGFVQTTVALKWAPGGGAPDTVSLYFEELALSPGGDRLVHAVLGPALGVTPPPWPGLAPVAVCLDHRGGRPVGGKDYWMVVDREDEPLQPLPGLPPALRAHRARFPFEPRRRTRRFLVVRRFDRRGLVGHKLMWMGEAQEARVAEFAWRHVDALIAEHAPPPSPTAAALDRLRRTWAHGGDAWLYPDLVSLDVDADGLPRRVLLYVSLK